MGVNILGVLVLFMCGVYAGRSAGDCRDGTWSFNRFLQRKVLSPDKTVPVRSSEECRQACQQATEFTCLSSTFDKVHERNCHLSVYNLKSDPARFTVNPYWDVYDMTCFGCNPDQEAFRRVEGYRTVVYFENVYTNSEETCKHECAMSDLCLLAVLEFTAEGQACRLSGLRLSNRPELFSDSEFAVVFEKMCTGKPLGSQCSRTRECADTNAVCVSRICRCRPGFVAGEYVCKRPVCGLPPVENAGYHAAKEEYHPGESVTVNECEGNLVFSGDKVLTCQQSGLWTGSAACRPYCVNGQISFSKHRYHHLRGHNRKVIQGIRASTCQMYCEMETEFLCRSFEHRILTCHLTDKSRETNPELYERSWTLWTYHEKKCGVRNPST